MRGVQLRTAAVPEHDAHQPLVPRPESEGDQWIVGEGGREGEAAHPCAPVEHVQPGEVERLGLGYPLAAAPRKAGPHGVLELDLDVDDLPGLDGLAAHELREADHGWRDLAFSAIGRGQGTGAAATARGHADLPGGRPPLSATAFSPDPHGRASVVEARLEGDVDVAVGRCEMELALGRDWVAVVHHTQ